MLQSDFERIIEGERRDVTCFFCDVRGFTSRAEQSSAVDLFSTLNNYFREIIDIVFQYQGTIDKFIGDSVMVVFGAPLAQANHALLAVKCAISIQQKVTELNHQVDFPITMGIGINSGEVIAGCIGSDRRMDYTVLGDVVNIAARLESQAQPNQILIGPTTYEAIRSTISCREVGALQLKGKADPLEAFEVIYSEESN
jgi:adenylate cyclase